MLIVLSCSGSVGFIGVRSLTRGSFFRLDTDRRQDLMLNPIIIAFVEKEGEGKSGLCLAR